MTFEGEQVNIPIKGIMRAGTDNLAADGAMNEVVGMEYKDGSLLPYKEKSTRASVVYLNKETAPYGYSMVVRGLKVKDVYVHKTFDSSTKHLFLSFADEYGAAENDLWYEAESPYGRYTYRVEKIVSDVKDLSIVGNMICVVTGSGVKHFLWKDHEYIEKTPALTNLPTVSFRVTKGVTDDDTPLSSEPSESPEGLMIREVIQGLGTDAITGAGIDDTMKDVVIGNLTAVRGELRDRGGLTGYVLACYAWQMKNGEYVRASAPVLLCRPMQISGNGVTDCQIPEDYNKVTDEFKDRWRENTSFYKYNPGSDYSLLTANDQDDKAAVVVWPFLGDFNNAPKFQWIVPRRLTRDIDNILFGYDFSSHPKYMYCGKDSEDMLQLVHKNGYYIERDGEILYKTSPSQGIDQKYLHAPGCPSLSCTIQARQTNSGSLLDCQINAFALSNALQFRIENYNNNIDFDQIQSLCLFISPEIDPYSSLDTDDFNGCTVGNFKGFRASGTVFNFHTHMYSAKRRSSSDIMKDIAGVKSMYLVKRLYKDDILELLPSGRTDSDWTGVPLKGLLGDSLVVQEQLPLTAFERVYTYPQFLDAYNMRLHEYNYMQEIFLDILPDVYSHHKGLGQIDEQTFQKVYSDGASHRMRSRMEIKVEIEDDSGERRTIVCHDEGLEYQIKNMCPFVIVPYKNAKKIHFRTIAYYMNNLYYIYEKEFELKKNGPLGFPYYSGDSFYPMIPSETGSEYNASMIFTADNKLAYYANGLKVSEAADPSYFPAQYTYRIGNEKIIKLARLTTPVSQDNFGSNQLIVFCTDGIYSMTVDPSGNGAYLSIPPVVSTEICVNRNSICEIGDAIFFAGEKGLMVLTGSGGVEQFTAYLNGMPSFLPASVQSKEAHGIYKKMIDSKQILSKNGEDFGDYISMIDFVDYIKNENTHLIYISNKNKLLAYNKSYDYTYFIDIQTQNTTKIPMSPFCDDKNTIGRQLWQGDSSYSLKEFGYLSHPSSDIPCLIQSRPIKIQQDDKSSFRLVLTGYFEGMAGDWADLIVFGSLDAEHWRVIGLKEKRLVGGFHNLGCITERGSWKYLMFIFGGKLNDNSHIDSIDLTVVGRYNNKKR